MGNFPHQDRHRGDACHRVTKIGQAKNCVAREEISVPGCEPFLRLERNLKLERRSLSGSQAQGQQGPARTINPYPPAVLRTQCFVRSEEHTSELQSLMRNSSAVFCLKTKKP